MQRPVLLSEAKQQLRDRPGDPQVFDRLLTFLNDTRSSELSAADAESFKEHKEKLLAAVNRLNDEEAWKVLDKVFDKSRTDKKRIDDQATGLTAVFWSGHPNYQGGRLQFVYQKFERVLRSKEEKEKKKKDDASNFFRAIREGKLTRVQEYLANPSFGLNIVNGAGLTPLIQAAYYGQLEIVNILLEKDVDVNQEATNGATAIYAAAQKNSVAIVKRLIEKNADVKKTLKGGFTPLLVASQNGHVDVVEALLTVSVSEINQAPDGNGSPLYNAACCGHVKVVAALLAKGADVKKTFKGGFTPLFVASQNGHVDVVKALLLVSVNEVNQASDCGKTPLYTAAYNGHGEVVVALLANGADVKKTVDGFTPLYVASKNNRIDVVKVLLSVKDIEVDQASDKGETPLYIAVIKRRTEIVKLLLEKGADVNKKINGEALLKIAFETYDTNIINCLIEATIKWLLRAQANDVTDELAQLLKRYKRRIFAVILKWPSIEQQQFVAQIFDEQKPDRKNLGTALGKVFCQGNSSIDKPNSQLGGIFEQCSALGLVTKPIKPSMLASVATFFAAADKGDQRPNDRALNKETKGESEENSTFKRYDNDKL